MSSRTLAGLVALVLVPASAGAGTTRPSLGLTANPARVALAGTAKASVRVTNSGRHSVVVDVERSGFSLDLRGRPRVVRAGGTRTARAWLRVAPRRFVLDAGASRLVQVSSRLPSRTTPGDHDALLLLTTRPRRAAGVAVRMRIGVVVVVRAPGRVVRRLTLGALRVRRERTRRILELTVRNRGNVTETIDRGRVRVWLRRGTSRRRLRPEPRELRPHTRGVVRLPYPPRLAGWSTVRIEVLAEPGRRALVRTGPTGTNVNDLMLAFVE